MTERVITMNAIQSQSAMNIFSKGISDSTRHMRKTSDGNVLQVGYISVTHKMAIARRRRCKRLYSQARRGFIV